MTFLEYIDELYCSGCKEHNIPDNPKKPFSIFIPIEPQNWEASSNFMISKQEKSKLFIVDGKQKVYLSDIHIISTILDMEKSLREWFMSQFVEMYRGLLLPFCFTIGSKHFVGRGMGRFSESIKLRLFSDSVIDINDFIFVINFVVSKDICWGDHIGATDFYQRTLCKYITLVDFYSINPSRSRHFLESIGYPLESSIPIDKAKNKTLFSNVKIFDISAYI